MAGKETRGRRHRVRGEKKMDDGGSSSPIRAVIVLLIVFLLVSALFFAPIMDVFNQSFWRGTVYPEKADFTIERRVELKNNGPRELSYNLTMAQPYDIPGSDIQYVDGIDWNITPTTYRKYGSDWNAWDRQIQPSESEEIIVSYDMRTSTVSWDYSAESSGTVDDIPENLKEQYNKNQWRVDRDDDGDHDWMIEPNNTEIESLAEDIVEDEDNIYDKSEAIYEWINTNIEYEISRTGELPKHSAWVLEDRTGDCDEQSFLYASLSRAVGIPAWIELGVLYDRVGERWGGHGWVRTIFIPENQNETGGWVNIDPVNDQFYFRDALRFTTWVDDGVEDHIGEFYYYISWQGDLSIENDDFEDVSMETEGRVVSGSGWAIPGFGAWIAVPAVLTSVVIYSTLNYKRKKR